MPFIPASLIDNQPATVKVQLPQAWIAHNFQDWINEHAEEFIERMLADHGVHIRQATGGSSLSGDITIIFVRES